MHNRHSRAHGTTLLALLGALLAACSADAGGGTKDTAQESNASKKAPSSEGSSGDTTAAETAPCVAKGAKGNDARIGAYCDATTKCEADRICTGDFGAPVGAQFCTKPCAKDADCGAGAVCYADTAGKGCVPSACLAP